MNDVRTIFDGPEYIRDSAAPWTDRVVSLSDFHVDVFRDRYPVTEGHLLFVPKFNTVKILNEAMEAAVREGQRAVGAGEYDGYNVGINMGVAAGQTVMWPHVHLIPRRVGDVTDPTGGVRHVIPEKGNYRRGNS